MYQLDGDMMLFKQLTASDAEAYRAWARENYKPLSEIKGIWHPVIQAECARINKEVRLSSVMDNPEGEGFAVKDA